MIETLEQRVMMSTYIITGLGDGAGAVTPGPSGIFFASTLRAAVNASNATANTDLLLFNPGLSGTVTLDPAAGQLTFSSDVILHAFGSDSITIDGGGASRVLAFGSNVHGWMYGLTIANGHAVNMGGGGVQNFGNLIIEDCTFTGNTATRSDGAGVYNAGTLDISDSTFIGNISDASGGGLYNRGNATITQCTFAAGNSATFGGGIYNLESTSMLVRDSTINGNHANFGGGIAAPITDASITPALTRVDNTIVAGNSVSVEGVGPDVYGFYQNASTNNLIGALAFATGFDPARNILGGIGNATPTVDPLLSPLGYYGRWTQTMPLLAGSPAQNAGNNSAIGLGLFADQRGGWRIVGGAVDIGAVEGAAGDPTPFATSIRFSDLIGLI